MSERSREHPPPRIGLCPIPSVLQWTQLCDWSHIIFASRSDTYNFDLSVRARKNLLNLTQRSMPSWIAGIHQKDHIIGSNVAFLLNPFVSSVQGRQVFLHQSPPTLGYEILCKPPSISGVEREVINDPRCKLSAHLAVKEVVWRQNVLIVVIAATISERVGIQNSLYFDHCGKQFFIRSSGLPKDCA